MIVEKRGLVHFKNVPDPFFTFLNNFYFFANIISMNIKTIFNNLTKYRKNYNFSIINDKFDNVENLLKDVYNETKRTDMRSYILEKEQDG